MNLSSDERVISVTIFKLCSHNWDLGQLHIQQYPKIFERLFAAGHLDRSHSQSGRWFTIYPEVIKVNAVFRRDIQGFAHHLINSWIWSWVLPGLGPAFGFLLAFTELTAAFSSAISDFFCLAYFLRFGSTISALSWLSSSLPAATSMGGERQAPIRWQRAANAFTIADFW